MKKHRDFLSIMKSKGLRLTPVRRAIVQYVLDHRKDSMTLGEIQDYIFSKFEGVNRTSIYRNLEILKTLEFIQELNLPSKGKCFQYVFDTKVHHFFICKSCGRLSKGNPLLFKKIEKAMDDIHGFKEANLSLVFYGICSRCHSREKK